MGTTLEDIRYEEAWSAMHEEIVMQNAAIAQCIYVFVEGESEEVAIPILLERCGIDLKKMGVIIANYNGIGNLKHSLRLLYKTLSHDRPVIVTYDNDLEGKRLLKNSSTNQELATFFSIPSKPKVTYSNGTQGGSFEEAFPYDIFISACFKSTKDKGNCFNEKSFRNSFNPTVPWFSQFAKYVKEHNGKPSSISKPIIGKYLVEKCDPVPKTFVKLSKVIKRKRKKFPIKHPDDIEMEI